MITGAASPTYAIGYTQAFAASPFDCDLEHNIYYWDETVSGDWKGPDDPSLTNLGFISSMDADNGAFVITTADRATYGIETTWKLKARLYLPDSIVEESVGLSQVEDVFWVTLKDPCADN